MRPCSWTLSPSWRQKSVAKFQKTCHDSVRAVQFLDSERVARIASTASEDSIRLGNIEEVDYARVIVGTKGERYVSSEVVGLLRHEHEDAIRIHHARLYYIRRSALQLSEKGFRYYAASRCSVSSLSDVSTPLL